MKTLTPADTSGPLDLAVSNPPHIKAAHGRINPKHPLAMARHEITITLPEILETARRMLGPAGRLAMIYPAGRLVDLMSGMRHHGIEPKKILFIYTRFGDCAKRVLVEGIKSGRPGIDIPPPLVLHGPDGAYSGAARKLFRPENEFFPAGNDFLFDTPAQNG
jgi:tRNA1(Val) A37 N6-methylase TrmN6